MPKPWKTTGEQEVLTGESTSRKRKKWQKERDRAIAVRMHTQGHIHADIAKFLNSREGVGYKISRRQVGDDIERAKNIARDLEENGDASAHLANAILKLEVVEQEAWEAWFRSWQDKEREVEKFGTTGLGASYDEVTKLKEGRIGDKRFLDVILRCIEQQNRLRNLYKLKIEVTGQQIVHHKAYVGISPADWDQIPSPQVKVIDQSQERLESGSSTSKTGDQPPNG